MKIGEEKNIKLTDNPKDLTEIDEQIKQASIENKKIKKRLKGMKQIIGQSIISDKNLIEWVKVGDGVYDYGEGEVENASFVVTMNWETVVGMLRDETNFNYLLKFSTEFFNKIQFEGSYMDAMKVYNFIEFAKDIMKGKKVKTKKKIKSKRKRKLKREELKKEIKRRDDLEFVKDTEEFRNFKPYECEYCGKLIKYFKMTICPYCKVELRRSNK